MSDNINQDLELQVKSEHPVVTLESQNPEINLRNENSQVNTGHEVLPSYLGPEDPENQATTSNLESKRNQEDIITETKAEKPKIQSQAEGTQEEASTGAVKRIRGNIKRSAAEIKEAEEFLKNFNPENSYRKARKIYQRMTVGYVAGAVYDYRGVHINTGIDLCDCYDLECQGCFSRCRKCASHKCGIRCRSNRKVMHKEVMVGTERRENPLDGL